MSAPILTVTAQKNPNAFLNDWSGSYGGVPAFTAYQLRDLKPAIKAAVQEKLEEYDAIAGNPKPATFENTIVAMEKAGKKLSQVKAVFDIYSSNMNSSEFEPIETEMTPIFSETNNKIYQNKKLFERIAAVYNSPEKPILTPVQQRMNWYHYSNLVC